MMPLDTFHHFAQYLTIVSINQGFPKWGFTSFLSVSPLASVRSVSPSAWISY